MCVRLSYPQVLLPPLTGLEALETSVSGGMLVIQARLSLNMAAHTLEQVRHTSMTAPPSLPPRASPCAPPSPLPVQLTDGPCPHPPSPRMHTRVTCTFEQVLSRRRKMLMDMMTGIELELRDLLDPKLATFAIRLLSQAMHFGPLSNHTEWFNSARTAAVAPTRDRARHSTILDHARHPEQAHP